MTGRDWLMPVTLILVVVLTVIPLPGVLQPLRPYWAALLLIYWNLEAGRMRKLGQAFLLGLVLDLVTGTLLGQHALSLVIINYLLERFRNRIRFFPPWQQALAVFGLLVNDRIVQLWVIGLVGRGWPDWTWWLPPLTGVVLWPWLFLLLDALRQRQRMAR